MCTMNVTDVMTAGEDLVTVELPGTRDDVLEYLQERVFSSVPVVKGTDDGEEFRGLVTRTALIDNPDEDQLALLVEEVPSIERGASIEELAKLMLREGARRVPVVADRRVAGGVARGDGPDNVGDRDDAFEATVDDGHPAGTLAEHQLGQ